MSVVADTDARRSMSDVSAVDLTPEVRAALRRYTEMTFGDLSDTERLAEFVYNAGWREAVAAMVRFQDLPGQISRIESRLHELGELVRRHGLQEEKEDERASVYWSSEP